MKIPSHISATAPDGSIWVILFASLMVFSFRPNRKYSDLKDVIYPQAMNAHRDLDGLAPIVTAALRKLNLDGDFSGHFYDEVTTLPARLEWEGGSLNLLGVPALRIGDDLASWSNRKWSHVLKVPALAPVALTTAVPPCELLATAAR